MFSANQHFGAGGDASGLSSDDGSTHADLTWSKLGDLRGNAADVQSPKYPKHFALASAINPSCEPSSCPKLFRQPFYCVSTAIEQLVGATSTQKVWATLDVGMSQKTKRRGNLAKTAGRSKAPKHVSDVHLTLR
jgi:hypothetical protein